jgi:hypothetical protein
MRAAFSALLADISALNILPCVVDGTRKKAALVESVVSISDRSRRLAFVLFWAPWRGPFKPTGCKLSLALLLIDKVSSVEETSEGWRFVWISSPTTRPCISSGYGSGGVSSASSNILTEGLFLIFGITVQLFHAAGAVALGKIGPGPLCCRSSFADIYSRGGHSRQAIIPHSTCFVSAFSTFFPPLLRMFFFFLFVSPFFTAETKTRRNSRETRAVGRH